MIKKTFLIASILLFSSNIAFANETGNFGISLKSASEEDEDMYLSEMSSVDVEGDFSKGNVPIVSSPNYTKSRFDDMARERLDPNTSLSNLIESKAESLEGEEGETGGKKRDTWLDVLRSEAVQEINNQPIKKEKILDVNEINEGESLSRMVEGSKTRDGRSNVAVFDVAGAMLRMTPIQIHEIVSKRGFKKTSDKIEIPNFIKWRKEDECRAAGVVGYERLASCVVQMAKKESYEYVETVRYSKFDSKENLVIHFTSNFTGNKSYRIEYNSEAAMVKGNTQKAIYMRNIKIFDFWKVINQKYGAPDNRDDAIWGMGGNKPYMQASTGRLILEDPMLRELDYTRMSREDQRFINTNTYNF